MKNIIRYIGIILVIAGILLVMKNLFSKEAPSTNNKLETQYYSAKIALLDKEANSYLTGATLVLKQETGEIIEKWTTEDRVHTINKLEKGNYIVEQESAPENYHKNEEGIKFQIKNKDEKVTMYNTKKTEAELDAERLQNTTSTQVGVDNTLSEKNIWSIIGGIAVITVGVALILIQRKSSSNDI